MKSHDEELLDQATRSMRAAAPEAGELSASAEKVAGRLGIAFAEKAEAIESCEDMRPLLDAYRSGTLSVGRTLLVESHLRECSLCYRRFRGAETVNWSAPKVMPARAKVRPLTMAWAMAASLAVAAAGYRLNPSLVFQIPLDSFANSACKSFARPPSQFRFDLAGVHSIAAIVAGPIFDKSN